MSNVKLYAMSDDEALQASSALGYVPFRRDERGFCQQRAITKLQTPLSPGAAIVAALFPDVDATVREALGRLVDAEIAHRSEIRFGATFISAYESYGMAWCWNNKPGMGFHDPMNVDAPAFFTDPAACVAAIDAVIRRVSDGK